MAGDGADFFPDLHLNGDWLNAHSIDLLTAPPRLVGDAVAE
jgi:hypothetical protein